MKKSRQSWRRTWRNVDSIQRQTYSIFLCQVWQGPTSKKHPQIVRGTGRCSLVAVNLCLSDNINKQVMWVACRSAECCHLVILQNLTVVCQQDLMHHQVRVTVTLAVCLWWIKLSLSEWNEWLMTLLLRQTNSNNNKTYKHTKF